MTETDLKYFLYSVVFHLTLVLVLTVKILAFPSVRPEMIRSVRVDFVAMPDKNPIEGAKGVEVEDAKIAPEKPAPIEKPTTKKEEKKETKKEEKKEKVEPPKKEKPIEKQAKDEPSDKKKPEDTSAKDQQSSALKRLEALSKIKKLKSSKEAGPAGTTYKGNELSAGASLTGVEKLQHDQYMENLDLHVRRNWQLPEWLSKKELTAAVLVRFDENGKILERRFIRSSGNETFDREVTQTIETSSPFPAPPEGLISYFKVHGIELRFPE